MSSVTSSPSSDHAPERTARWRTGWRSPSPRHRAPGGTQCRPVEASNPARRRARSGAPLRRRPLRRSPAHTSMSALVRLAARGRVDGGIVTPSRTVGRGRAAPRHRQRPRRPWRSSAVRARPIRSAAPRSTRARAEHRRHETVAIELPVELQRPASWNVAKMARSAPTSSRIRATGVDHSTRNDARCACGPEWRDRDGTDHPRNPGGPRPNGPSGWGCGGRQRPHSS